MSFERDPDGNWCGVGARQYATFTGATTLTGTLTPATNGVLVGAHLHFSAQGQGSDTFTLTLDSINGAAYDTVIYAKSMTGLTDHSVMFNAPIEFERGDLIKVGGVNGGSATWGLTLIWRKVG